MDIVWSLAICVFCTLLMKSGRNEKWLKSAVLVYALLLILCCNVQGTL